MTDSRSFQSSPAHLVPAFCTITPPYLLERVAASDLPEAPSAQRTLLLDEQRRQARFRHDVRTAQTGPAVSAPGAADSRPNRLISDAAGEEVLPGSPVRAEGEPTSADVAVNEAYDGLGATWQLLFAEFERDSLDDKGLPLPATVHYGRGYDNAFWDGTQMVFGDGDGQIFNRFTIAVDVIGHELAHGITEHTAGLMYSGQSGALNESISDVFGSMVKQRLAGQSATEADWLIGAGLLTDSVNGVALRSMLEPGTAYDDPVLGRDPQPATMSEFVKTREDNGGVHINSGIPNRAFALFARQLGGRAWEQAGQVWYDVLVGDGIKADCDFATFAGLTRAACTELFGPRSAQLQALDQAWAAVEISPVTHRKAKRGKRIDLTTGTAAAAAHRDRGVER